MAAPLGLAAGSSSSLSYSLSYEPDDDSSSFLAVLAAGAASAAAGITPAVVVDVDAAAAAELSADADKTPDVDDDDDDDADDDGAVSRNVLSVASSVAFSLVNCSTCSRVSLSSFSNLLALASVDSAAVDCAAAIVGRQRRNKRRPDLGDEQALGGGARLDLLVELVAQPVFQLLACQRSDVSATCRQKYRTRCAPTAGRRFGLTHGTLAARHDELCDVGAPMSARQPDANTAPTA